jgi:signal transduction histidine kinase
MRSKSLQNDLIVRFSLLTIALMLVVVSSFAWHLIEEHKDHIHNVRQFIVDILLHIGWLFALATVLTVFLAVLIVRQSLGPLRELAAQAREIRPGSPFMKINESTLPAEVVPLVTAFEEAVEFLNCALETQARFTANAAHELRTPLAALAGRLDRLAESGVANEAIQKLQADCTRMTRLIGQLTALSRAESSTEMPNSCTALAPLLRLVVSDLAPVAASRDVRIGMELASECLTARGAPETIEVMLRNVIENAVLHAPAGTEVVVQLRTDMVVAVEDAGPGIPASLRDQVFERFWRGSWSRHEGSGLGLAIVREAAARVGGEVLLEDASIGGTRVIMHFQTG